MTDPDAFTLFLLVYGLAASYCGWCLCRAKHKKPPQQPPDEIGNRSRISFRDERWDN